MPGNDGMSKLTLSKSRSTKWVLAFRWLLVALGLHLSCVTTGRASLGMTRWLPSAAFLATQPPAPAAPLRKDDGLGRLRAIFESYDLPSELIWLAEVESGFNPKARSRAGAVGLYQLMPVTAKALGLELGPHDERLHPDKNATAAARHLRYLYGRYRDWRLVLAAYNAGEARVSRLLRARPGRRYEDIARHLPRETRQYVPKVEATLRLREQVTLASLPAPGA